jgi:short-subunit dehydrogenase
MQNFHEKIIVVTGATSGIGKAISEQLKKSKAKLILLGRDFSKVGALLREDESCFHYKVDLTDHQQIMDFTQSIKNKFEKIDFLIHSAGILISGNMDKVDIASLDQQYLVNCRAPYLLTQQLLPEIKIADGTIVFVNSTTGLKAWEGIGQYSASKFALKAVADSLRCELKNDHVNVLSVYPAGTSSPMQESFQKENDRIYNPEMFMNPEDVAAKIISAMIPLGKTGVVDLTIRPR